MPLCKCDMHIVHGFPGRFICVGCFIRAKWSGVPGRFICVKKIFLENLWVQFFEKKFSSRFRTWDVRLLASYLIPTNLDLLPLIISYGPKNSPLPQRYSQCNFGNLRHLKVSNEIQVVEGHALQTTAQLANITVAQDRIVTCGRETLEKPHTQNIWSNHSTNRRTVVKWETKIVGIVNLDRICQKKMAYPPCFWMRKARKSVKHINRRDAKHTSAEPQIAKPLPKSRAKAAFSRGPFIFLQKFKRTGICWSKHTKEVALHGFPSVGLELDAIHGTLCLEISAVHRRVLKKTTDLVFDAAE